MFVGSVRGQFSIQFFVKQVKEVVILVGDLFPPLGLRGFCFDGLVDLIERECDWLGSLG